MKSDYLYKVVVCVTMIVFYSLLIVALIITFIIPGLNWVVLSKVCEYNRDLLRKMES